jgi:hypothetical protein
LGGLAAVIPALILALTLTALWALWRAMKE